MSGDNKDPRSLVTVRTEIKGEADIRYFTNTKLAARWLLEALKQLGSDETVIVSPLGKRSPKEEGTAEALDLLWCFNHIQSPWKLGVRVKAPNGNEGSFLVTRKWCNMPPISNEQFEQTGFMFSEKF